MQTIADWIFEEQDKQSNKPILTTFSGEYTLSDIEKGMNDNLSLLNEFGTIKRKKVALLIPQVHSYLQMFLAVNHLGGVVVPLSWQLRKGDLTALLDFLDPDIVFTIREYNGFVFSDVVTHWAENTVEKTIVFDSEDGVNWSELHLFQGKERPLVTEGADVIAPSSGSTGLPKGVMVDNQYIIKHSDTLGTMFQLNGQDRLFENLHPSMLQGLLWLVAGLKKQYLTVIPETFDVPQVVRLFRETHPTKMCTTPSLLSSIYTFAKGMNALDGFDCLKVTVLVGEMIAKELIDTVSNDIRCRFISFYGASEAGLLMCTTSDLRESVEWEVCEGIDYRLVDGEILFKVPKPFLGYYQSPDLTKEVLDVKGWYASGDLAVLNQKNKMVLMGRKKDLIKKGGQSIIPGEIEHTLVCHPKVKQAVLVGVPHPVFGEQVVAFIVKEGEVSPQELKRFCSKKIAAYKVPDQCLFIDEIPINNGKADRMTLRKKAQSRGGKNI